MSTPAPWGGPGPGGRPVGGRRRGGRARFLPLLGVGLLLVPLVEIVVAVLVGRALGGWPTVLLILLGCLLGMVVLRRVGLQALRSWRSRAEQLQEQLRAQQAGAGAAAPGTGVPGATAAGTGSTPGARSGGDTALLGLAGLLLLVPGLVTDVAGLLLLLPPVRRFVRTRTTRAVAAAVDRAVITRTGTSMRHTVVTGDAVTVEVVDVRGTPPGPDGPARPALRGSEVGSGEGGPTEGGADGGGGAEGRPSRGPAGGGRPGSASDDRDGTGGPRA